MTEASPEQPYAVYYDPGNGNVVTISAETQEIVADHIASKNGRVIEATPNTIFRLVRAAKEASANK